MDKSNGYEAAAEIFIQWRGQTDTGIGTSIVQSWARTLPKNAIVLDLGCGTGFPIAKVLFDEGLHVYGIDASNTLINTFLKNFPNACVACEAVEDSTFFNRQFDAIIAWGLIFLLSEDAQENAIQKSAIALNIGGKLLFTAPAQKTEWIDVMTGALSRSLGSDKYKALLAASGLQLLEEFEDEGGNHYYHALKTVK